MTPLRITGHRPHASDQRSHARTASIAVLYALAIGAVAVAIIFALGKSSTGTGTRASANSHVSGSSLTSARSHASAVAATSSVTARVPVHIATWAADDGCNGGEGATASLVRRWVTFAYSNCGPNATKAQADCHAGSKRYCYVMQYIDSDWNYPDGPVPNYAQSLASWWLHDPTPNQNTRVSTTGGGYLLDQRSPVTRQFFANYVRAHFNGDDGLEMDWQSASLASELYGSNCNCTSTAEIANNAGLQAAHAEMSAALTHADGQPFMQVDNSLGTNSWLPQGFNMLDHRIGVVGLSVEGEPLNYGVLDSSYSTLLDQMAYIDNRTNSFLVVLARGAAGAPYELRSRRVVEATMLLGYKPGHLVDWEDLEEGYGSLPVWPEEGIVPTGAVQTMRGPGGSGCLAGTGNVCSFGGHNSGNHPIILQSLLTELSLPWSSNAGPPPKPSNTFSAAPSSA